MTALLGGPALEVSGLSKVFRGEVAALSGVNLSLPRGTITGLVGPNGAGKSTLMRAWIGFERPTRGSLRVCGVDPMRDRQRVLMSVGYVPQTPSLYRELTVREQIEVVRDLRSGFDHDLARRRLLGPRIGLGQRVGELSGGQRAQLYLALVIGLHAPVLLLDEPLASLDPLARREFLATMVEAVRADGSTAVLSSHVIGDIEQACDHLVVIGTGRVLLDAPIAAVLATHVVARSDASFDAAMAEVGAFADGAGMTRILRAASAGGQVTTAPTLEQIVLGYLSASRGPGEKPR